MNMEWCNWQCSHIEHELVAFVNTPIKIESSRQLGILR